MTLRGTRSAEPLEFMGPGQLPCMSHTARPEPVAAIWTSQHRARHPQTHHGDVADDQAVGRIAP